MDEDSKSVFILKLFKERMLHVLCVSHKKNTGFLVCAKTSKNRNNKSYN